MRRALAFLLLALASCAETGQPAKLDLSPVTFDDLPGWRSDHQSEAIPGFARSCTLLAKKPDWQIPCTTLTQVPVHDDKAARWFFENYFTPYTVNDNQAGLFTGYYEAGLRGSLRKTKRYHVPLYARPRDLVTADLGLFKPEWKGQHITGKVAAAHFIPYDERAAIEKNSLQGRARVLLWVDDPIDAFFLAIQGSGRVKLPNGHFVRVGYDGANGRAYVALGKVLAAMDAIEKPVTMQKIRAWLAAHPDRAEDIMNMNPSYVFFRRIQGEGPIGAEGVALTPMRSLAADPAFMKLGTPLWIDTSDGNGAVLQRLMVAQDTGGAIKGPVRGDFFWGGGVEAAAQAGVMQSSGHYYLLLPKNVAADAGQ